MLKVLFATALVSLVVGSFGAANAAATDAPPSWQAICGYKWRAFKQAHPEVSGRDAFNEFRRKPEAEGGCGAKAGKAGNQDEKIREYLEQHKPRTENTDDADMILEARRGRK